MDLFITEHTMVDGLFDPEGPDTPFWWHFEHDGHVIQGAASTRAKAKAQGVREARALGLEVADVRDVVLPTADDAVG